MWWSWRQFGGRTAIQLESIRSSLWVSRLSMRLCFGYEAISVEVVSLVTERPLGYSYPVGVEGVPDSATASVSGHPVAFLGTGPKPRAMPFALACRPVGPEVRVSEGGTCAIRGVLFESDQAPRGRPLIPLVPFSPRGAKGRSSLLHRPGADTANV